MITLHAFSIGAVFLSYLTLKRQYHKMVKHTQTIRQQIANELFDCV